MNVSLKTTNFIAFLAEIQQNSCMTYMQKIDKHNKKACPMRKINRNLLELAIAETKHHAHLKENVCKRELCTKP